MIIDESIKSFLRRCWETACQDNPARPSCTVEDGHFVLKIGGDRSNWPDLLVANGVPDYALQEEEGDTLTCWWPSEADDIFGEGGRMARYSEKYEMRKPQLYMARMIQRAIEMGETTVIEAGTGTGKSFAYAAICLAMGKRVVISTSNKALQAQLYKKDLPFLANLFPNVTYALALGKSNYACKDKVEGEGGGLFVQEVIEDPQLREWYFSTQTGNVEEIRFPVSRDDLAKITVDDDCTGRKCPLYGACHYYKAKEQRMAAQVVICNHALLAQNHITGGNLLPEWDVLVVDEAHNLIGNVRDAVGAELTVNAIRKHIKACAPYVASQTLQFAEACVDEMVEEVFGQHVAGDVINQVEVPDGKQFPKTETLALRLYELAGMVWDEGDEPLNKEEAKQAKRADRVSSAAVRISQFRGGNYVRWLEVGRDRQALMSMPAYVGDWVQAMIGPRPAVLASATLATPSLRPYLDGIGAVDALQMIAKSPFDYKSNALIYVPRTSDPKPKEEGYNRWLAEQLSALVNASKGGALLLFTSYKMMNDMHISLAYTFKTLHKLNVLKQGVSPRQELLREFRNDGNAVLFATRSFFEGVDVGGSALRLVVLDKLPFEAPSPMLKALEKMAGARWFEDGYMPMTLTTLKQAAGRLIRTQTDRGVIAVLDSRIRAQWASRVFESLPPAPNTSQIADVVQFFAGAPKEPVAVQESLFA